MECKLDKEERSLRAAQVKKQKAEDQRDRGPRHNPNRWDTEAEIMRWWAVIQDIKRDMDRMESDLSRYGQFGTYYR